MVTLVCALSVLAVGGVVCGATSRYPAVANRIGGLTGLAAGALAVAAGLQVLQGHPTDVLTLPWQMPGGVLSLQMDGLSAFFVVVIGLISGLAALYGMAYLQPYQGQRNLGLVWTFYHLLIAAMLVVVTSRNAVLFLVSWEIMALASFLLVMFEHEHGEVVKAGWIYLVATHVGTAFLLALFVMLGKASNSMDFADFHMPVSGLAGGVMFLLAVIGFGAKAGFVPMHVWLPEAHPAAPSFVSCVMSGVMIKTGIYGLLRLMTWTGNPGSLEPVLPPLWWGQVLVGIGVTSGILGVLFALAQHDLKRLLAYHSVENIGIITLGLGIGLLGLSTGKPVVATLGLAGGLLHVLNHAVFKGLLFLGAGSVLHATGTRQIEQMGGLMKRMPTTATTFLVGSAAISGLPPFNGFISELLIYMAAFSALATGLLAAGATVIFSLALIGGLAAACFAKAFGIVFLGQPRSDVVARSHEAPLTMRVPLIILAALCGALGLSGPWVIRWVLTAIGPLIPEPLLAPVAGTLKTLQMVSVMALALAVLVLVLAGLRYRLLAGRSVRKAGTWDCGYAAPSARMQYTASSFAQPLVGMFKPVLRTRVTVEPAKDFWPRHSHLHTHTDDVFLQSGFRPAFLSAGWVASRLRWLQQGRIQMYVLYIAITVLVLLLWKLGVPS